MKLGIIVAERISLDVHLRIIKITNIPDAAYFAKQVPAFRKNGVTSQKTRNFKSPNVSMLRTSYRLVRRRNLLEL